MRITDLMNNLISIQFKIVKKKKIIANALYSLYNFIIFVFGILSLKFKYPLALRDKPSLKLLNVFVKYD